MRAKRQTWRVQIGVRKAELVDGRAKFAAGRNPVKTSPSDVRKKQMGPTLLPTPLLPSRGLLFRRTFLEALGNRFLSPPTGWRFFSPTLASASGLAFRSVLLFRAEAFPSGAFLSTLPRPFPLLGCFPQAAGFCLSFHLPSFHNQVPGLSSERASRSSRATALASGLHFLHVQSQRPRGQYPLRRLI